MTILEMYHRGICLPRKSIAVKAEIQTIFLREIDQIAKSDTFFGGLLKVAEYFLRMDNDLNCIKYCVSSSHLADLSYSILIHTFSSFEC